MDKYGRKTVPGSVVDAFEINVMSVLYIDDTTAILQFIDNVSTLDRTQYLVVTSDTKIIKNLPSKFVPLLDKYSYCFQYPNNTRQIITKIHPNKVFGDVDMMNEIRTLPGIGVDYFEALSRFDRNKVMTI